MDNEKTQKQTEIVVKTGKAIGVSSRVHGANIDAVAFNIEFIASKNPALAVAVLKLYKEATAIKEDDPQHPEEDYGMVLDEISKL